MAFKHKFLRLKGPLAQLISKDIQFGPGLLPESIAAWRISDTVSLQRWAQQVRYFQTASPVLKDIEVEIQAMGESISEGTIAEVLKKEGESVAEDETIAQIETDKVTIDVKAPSAGVIKQLKVSADDTVRVGQVVAIIGEGQGSDSESSSGATSTSEDSQKGKSEEDSGSAPKEEQQSRQKQGGSSVSGLGASHTSGRSHQPLLKFPARMTPDGRRISELPAGEQQEFGSHGKKTEQSDKATTERAQAKPDSQPVKSFIPWYVGREQGTKLSQSSVLSDFEMEQIELGGAEP